MSAGLKRVCVFFAVLLLLTVTASALFMAFGASHCCCGEDCAICRELAWMRSAAGSFGALAAAAGICALLGAFIATAQRPIICIRAEDTPITQRVKLTR